MPRKARTISKTGIYHIMLRGANRQEIFHDDRDCMKFLEILKIYKTKSEFNIFAWCLMNNHVHLLIKVGNESISTTMQRIGISYVSYYNLKYHTTGHLFQDRFRSENVESTRYLLTVIRYIHQNPVKAGMTKKPDEWKWSSSAGYYEKANDSNKMLDKKTILQMFSTEETVAKKKFKEFNETKNHDECLDEKLTLRLTDEQARVKIKRKLGAIEFVQIKSLPREQRNELLRQIKKVEGLSQRQAARILGISPSLIFKA